MLPDDPQTIFVTQSLRRTKVSLRTCYAPLEEPRRGWAAGLQSFTTREKETSDGSLRTENLYAQSRHNGGGREALSGGWLSGTLEGAHDKKLVGYFQADTGTINQLLHLWKFDDDADRRAHWAAVYANKEFVDGFASKFRPLLMTQEVKLLQAAPWGPHP